MASLQDSQVMRPLPYSSEGDALLSVPASVSDLSSARSAKGSVAAARATGDRGGGSLRFCGMLSADR